ncbi:MAG: 3-oxoacyl-ACP reductase [Streptosporangiaceae bacterium]|jgi:3-oxoacyl-[acyl-carrier protein] reductase|nr:3-oxoacyl-ACP reductase [Streptosporangiaceae bacterium]
MSVREGRLHSKAAIITGAARGIGAATARLFADEGALLCLNDKAEKPLLALAAELRDAGGAAITVPGDVSDPQIASQLVKTCIEAYDRLDILVNNAGVIYHSAVAELGIEEWDATLATDLTATFLCTRAAIPQMVAQKAGRIINVSSQLALRGAPGFAAYCAAKAGVVGFSKAVARELAPHAITVNCVAPGPVDTDMLLQGGNNWSEDDINQLPLRRIGRPEEVAPTVLFLASDPDGNLFTGQTLGPNSGDVMP